MIDHVPLIHVLRYRLEVRLAKVVARPIWAHRELRDSTVSSAEATRAGSVPGAALNPEVVQIISESLPANLTGKPAVTLTEQADARQAFWTSWSAKLQTGLLCLTRKRQQRDLDVTTLQAIRAKQAAYETLRESAEAVFLGLLAIMLGREMLRI